MDADLYELYQKKLKNREFREKFRIRCEVCGFETAVIDSTLPWYVGYHGFGWEVVSDVGCIINLVRWFFRLFWMIMLVPSCLMLIVAVGASSDSGGFALMFVLALFCFLFDFGVFWIKRSTKKSAFIRTAYVSCSTCGHVQKPSRDEWIKILNQ